jgi:hypothetical protein
MIFAEINVKNAVYLASLPAKTSPCALLTSLTGSKSKSPNTVEPLPDIAA